MTSESGIKPWTEHLEQCIGWLETIRQELHLRGSLLEIGEAEALAMKAQAVGILGGALEDKLLDIAKAKGAA